MPHNPHTEPLGAPVASTLPTPSAGENNAPAARLVVHGWRYETNIKTGVWRAGCSCGWTFAGKRDEVITRAVGHDIDAELVP